MRWGPETLLRVPAPHQLLSYREPASAGTKVTLMSAQKDKWQKCGGLRKDAQGKETQNESVSSSVISPTVVGEEAGFCRACPPPVYLCPWAWIHQPPPPPPAGDTAGT